MISTDGKVYIKRYLASQVPAIAQCISYGIGGVAESVGHKALQFEVGRSEITLISYDFVNDKIIFKAELPNDFAGTLYEVALFSQMENPSAGNFGSKIIATFDSDSELWVDSTSGVEGTYSATQARIGGDALVHSPAASATKSNILNDLFLDLSGNSGADVFSLAYYVDNSFTSSVSVRFKTDSSNYFTITKATPTSGYRVDTFTKGSATATGAPSWENITSIEVIVTSTGGGGATVRFDGLRIEDADTPNPEYVMVARELLSTPFVKEDGKVQEIEYALSVTV